MSNLPYQVTSVDLQTLFSDIAPVRSAFVVLESATGVSKGVGYVSFALKEDAQSALETISKDGIQIAGRSLRVQFADSKVNLSHFTTCLIILSPRIRSSARVNLDQRLEHVYSLQRIHWR